MTMREKNMIGPDDNDGEGSGGEGEEE